MQLNKYESLPKEEIQRFIDGYFDKLEFYTEIAPKIEEWINPGKLRV